MNQFATKAAPAGPQRRSIPARVLSRLVATVERPFRAASKWLSRRGLYSFLEEQMETIAPRSSVLLVGSSGGIDDLVRSAAARIGFQVMSMDIDPARKPDIVGDLCSHDFGRPFDVILVPEVLEHIVTPHVAIDNVHRFLRPGGKAIVTTPFIFPIHDRPHDFFRYTRYGLAYLLREFQSVDIRARNSWGEAIAVLWARFLIEKHWTARLFFPVGAALALIQLPLLIVLGKVVKTDNMTTGYVTVAVKAGGDASGARQLRGGSARGAPA